MATSTFYDGTPECQVCDTPTVFVGTLGRLEWWRCPACGLDQHTPADDDAADPWDGAEEW